MSLPLLVRGLVMSPEHAARTIGLLYGANALGAALGGLATPWILVRFLGIDGAVLVGAGLSAVAGLGALVLASFTKEGAVAPCIVLCQMKSRCRHSARSRRQSHST